MPVVVRPESSQCARSARPMKLSAPVMNRVTKQPSLLEYRRRWLGARGAEERLLQIDHALWVDGNPSSVKTAGTSTSSRSALGRDQSILNRRPTSTTALARQFRSAPLRKRSPYRLVRFPSAS